MTKGGGRAAPPRDPQALLAFALRHVVVTGFLGSHQHTERNGYALPERTVRDYNLIYVWRGAAAWTVGGVEHRLREGDLIVALGEEPVRGVDDLHRLLTGHDATRANVLKVIRLTERVDLEILPEERPASH